MEKRKILLSTLALFGLIAFASVLSFSTDLQTDSINEISAADCSHNYGNHYYEKEPSCTEDGYYEHWVCCSCHKVFLSKPSNGTWSDKSILGYEMTHNNIAYRSFSHYTTSTPQENSSNIGLMEASCDKCKSNYECDERMSGVSSFTSKDDFGTNADGLTKDTDEGAMGKKGGLCWSVGSSLATKSIKLPKINFSVFNNVSIKWSSSTAIWDTVGITLGIAPSDNNLLPSHGLVNCLHGSFECIYNQSSGILSVKSVSSDGQTHEVCLTDGKIINGSNSLVLNFTAKQYRSFYVLGIYTNHTHSGTKQNRTDKIGFYIGSCTLCGGVFETGYAMTKSDYAITSISDYGMRTDGNDGQLFAKGSQVSGSGEENTVRYIIDGKTGNINFPKIDYSAFKNVTLRLGSDSEDGWGKVGFGLTSNLELSKKIDHGQNATWILKFEYNEEKDDVTIKSTCSDGTFLSAKLSDKEIIHGYKGLTLLGDFGVYRSVYLNEIALNHTHLITHYTIDSTSSIGNRTAYCKTCKSNILIPIQTEEISFSNSKNYGCNSSSLLVGNEEGNNGHTPGVRWIEDEGAVVMPMGLQKIDYSAYESVDFIWCSNSYSDIQIGLGINSNDDLLPKTNHGKNVSGTINVKYSDSKLYIKVTTSDNYVNTVTLNDDDIANGLKSLTINFDSRLYRGFYLNSIILNQKSLNDDYVKTKTVNGVLAPDFEKENGCEIIAYGVPGNHGEETRANTLYKGLKDAYFTNAFSLYDGRSYTTMLELGQYVGEYLVNPTNANLQILISKIDTYSSEMLSSTKVGLKSARDNGILYRALNEGFFNFDDIISKATEYVESKYGSSLPLMNDAQYKLIADRFLYNMQLDNYEGLAGVELNDEPTSSKFRQLSIATKLIKDKYPYLNEGFINLLPFNDTWNEEYYGKYMSLIYPSTGYLSYDYYPLKKVDSNALYHLKCLETTSELIHNANNGGDLKTYVHATNTAWDTGYNACSSANDILYQMNSSFVFGCRSFEYFSYSNQSEDAKDTSHNTTNGIVNYYTCAKSPVYDYAKEANKATSYLANILATFDYQTTVCYGGSTRFDQTLNLKNNKFNGLKSCYSQEDPLLVGCFQNGNAEAYLMNAYSRPDLDSTTNAFSLTLNGDYNHCLLYKDNTVSVVDIENNIFATTLAPGNACVVIPFN